MSSAAVAREISDAIYAKLDTDLGAVPVGDGIAPASTGTPPLYAVLDQQDGTVRDTLVRDDRWVKVVVQVRCVGATRSAAQYVQDLVRTSLLDRTLTVSGVTLMSVDLEVGGRVAADDDADPSTLFMAFDRYAFLFDVRA